MGADSKSGRLFGVAGVLAALCCLAGPALIGAAAGAAIGNLLGIAAAVVLALVGVVLVRRLRRSDEAC
jgi:drug/metabolite transporter (DMT)-like permease